MTHIHSNNVRYWLRDYHEWGIKYYNYHVQLEGAWYWSNNFNQFHEVMNDFACFVMEIRPCNCGSQRGTIDYDGNFECSNCKREQELTRFWKPRIG